MKRCLRWSSETMWQWKNTWKMISNWFRVDGFDWQMMRRAAAEGTGVVVVVPDRRCRRHGDRSSFPALMLGMTVVVVVAAAVLATSPGSLFLLPGASAAVQTTVKNVQQQQQLRVKPQPSSSVASSGLPVPDLLESPDAKYDPKPKDIDAAALRLRLKGEFNLFEIYSHIDTPLPRSSGFDRIKSMIQLEKLFVFCVCVWRGITKPNKRRGRLLYFSRQNVVHVTRRISTVAWVTESIHFDCFSYSFKIFTCLTRTRGGGALLESSWYMRMDGWISIMKSMLSIYSI